MESTVIHTLPDPRTLPRPEKPKPDTRADAAKKGWTKRKGMETPPSIRHNFVAGKLPGNCKDIQNRGDRIRRMLESAVLDAKGEIGITDASCINSAIRWERHAQLCNRWLLNNHGAMSHADKLKFSRETADASDKRDKAIRQLGLDKDSEHDLVTALYSPAVEAKAE